MTERWMLVVVATGAVCVSRCFFASTPTAAAPEAAVLRAERFELVDPSGQVRASLKVEPSGEVVFRLLDGDGTIRVKLGASEDGSGLLLLDDRTEPAVHVSAKRTGTSITLAEMGKPPYVVRP